MRVWLFALPYGDQAIFVRRPVLEAMGGVPDASVLEDLDLVAGMRGYGRLAALPEIAMTSVRRYQDQGICRTVGLHFVALVGWRLGVDRGRLARWLSR